MTGEVKQEARQEEQKQDVRVDNRTVKTYQPVDTRELTIRLMDWRRVYRKVLRIPDHSSKYSNLMSLAAGVAAGAFFALIAEYQGGGQNLEAWVKPTTWAIFVASALLSVVFGRVSRDRDSEIKTSCDEVKLDMKEIHQCYFPGKDVDSDV